ncbi:hypothetical protein ACRE_039560 [Hapsidospora chrysogenum ATCC 11550]|uniref:Uncharacterized protein n=1 Tax=Hapsidospora chrysogenum (strain ATCC 11550 / CBS 779.69 / DSM 880 / IAM 14645 / JCM 23072 / IMI 49137) TaxID=857340 RepID=A0A086T7D7_HAPC1|nr:hypothetical protein ACRE_039560 [Hapsidospora chrysogenum ATCC 11550]
MGHHEVNRWQYGGMADTSALPNGDAASDVTQRLVLSKDAALRGPNGKPQTMASIERYDLRRYRTPCNAVARGNPSSNP